MGESAFIDLNSRYKFRFFVNTVLVTSVMMFLHLFIARLYIVDSLPSIVGVLCCVFHLFSPCLYRIHKSYNLCVSSMLFFGTVWITVFSYFNGGIESSVLLWLALIPILAGVLSGKRLLMMAFILVVLVSVSFVIQVYFNSIPFNHLSSEGIRTTKLVHLFGYLVLSFFLSYSFGIKESIRSSEFRNKADYTESLYQVLIHDIKSPLFILKNMINKVSKNYDDDSHISKMKKATYLLDELVESITRSYLYSSNFQSVNKVENSMHTLISDCLQVYHDKFLVKSLRIEVDPSVKHVNVVCDSKVFKKQVLMSLLSNALKFSHENSTISIYVSRHSQYCDLCILDRGIGVPEELVASIFDGGKSISSTGTYGETGTGYGLFIAKKTLKALGGKLFLNSYDDVSPDATIATVRLPLSIMA